MKRILTYIPITSNHLVCICVIRKKYYKYFFSIDVGYSFHSFNSLLKNHIHLRNFNFQFKIVNCQLSIFNFQFSISFVNHSK